MEMELPPPLSAGAARGSAPRKRHSYRPLTPPPPAEDRELFLRAVKMGRKHFKNGNGWSANICASERSRLVENSSFAE